MSQEKKSPLFVNNFVKIFLIFIVVRTEQSSLALGSSPLGLTRALLVLGSVVEIVIDVHDCAHGITTMYYRHFNRAIYTLQVIQQ